MAKCACDLCVQVGQENGSGIVHHRGHDLLIPHVAISNIVFERNINNTFFIVIPIWSNIFGRGKWQPCWRYWPKLQWVLKEGLGKHSSDACEGRWTKYDQRHLL